MRKESVIKDIFFLMKYGVLGALLGVVLLAVSAVILWLPTLWSKAYTWLFYHVGDFAIAVLAIFLTISLVQLMNSHE